MEDAITVVVKPLGCGKLCERQKMKEKIDVLAFWMAYLYIFVTDRRSTDIFDLSEGSNKWQAIAPCIVSIVPDGATWLSIFYLVGGWKEVSLYKRYLTIFTMPPFAWI